MIATAIAVLLAAADPEKPTPSMAVTAAHADVMRLDPITAAATRYLYAGNLPAVERAELYAAFSGHVNLLSREGFIVRPRKVNAWLWAIDARDYGWPLEAYGALGFTAGTIEPYFHVEPLDVTTGKTTRPLVSAPWLPVQMGELLKRTNSSVPLVRADWLINRTGIQEGRAGHGYYDFLGFKSRADAEKLAGLDRAKAIAIYRELGAVVPTSGVALQGRQAFRFATLGGSWWESRDTKGDKNSSAARNPERQLLEDYKHDAEEIVATLPNRLPFFYLSDAAGKQIDSAPPDVASDSKSASNDRRVHPGLSCIRCHESAGLKQFEDHARGLYAAGGALSLGSTDDAKFRRLRSVYLGPLEKSFKGDSELYGDAIKEATGLGPADFSATYARQWSRYIDEPVTAARLADEVGLDEAELAGRLRAYADANKLIDPVLAAYLTKPPRSVRREQIEEAFPLLMRAVGGEP